MSPPRADHVASRQRGNLRALISGADAGWGRRRCRGISPSAAIRCTEDATMRLDGRAVSAVRGRIAGAGVGVSYPGEVPDAPPDEAFWAGEFFDLPEFRANAVAQCRACGRAPYRTRRAGEFPVGRFAVRPPVTRVIIEDATAPRLEPEMPVVEALVDPAPRAGGASVGPGRGCGAGLSGWPHYRPGTSLPRSSTARPGWAG